MFGLPLVDILVIIVYFGVVLAIGVWASRHIKGEEDFFLAGRRFGKLIQTFAAFGQGTSADNAVGVSTTTFNNGASGIWSSMLYLFATPIFWFTSAWMRRLRLMTLGDFFVERYNSKRMGATYALIGAFGMMAFIALGFNAMAKTVIAITPKPAVEFTQAERQEYNDTYQQSIAADIVTVDQMLSMDELIERQSLAGTSDLTESQQVRLDLLQTQKPAQIISYLKLEILIWLTCIVVLLYASAGGLEAAFLTDMLQGVGIIVLSVILVPFAWAKINVIYGGTGMMGALSTIHSRLPNSFFDMFGSPNAIDFTWYYIIALSIMAMLTVVVQPNNLLAPASAKDESSARYGFVIGIYMKRTCTVFWGVFGLAAIVLYGSSVHNSDLVWGYATRDLLGPLNLGLVGLMIACLMAALMSTADCLMLTCSSLLTHNLYRMFAPNKTQKHYVWVGRILGASVLLGAAWIALQFDTILQILKFIWEMNVALVPAFWLGMKWRRASRKGAWVSITVGVIAFLILPMLIPAMAPGLRTNEKLLKRTHPAPLVCSYDASEADVRIRQSEINEWTAVGSIGEAPAALELGESFSKTYDLPRKGLFWTQGVKADSDGKLYGKGALSLELVLLDKMGINLENNPYALNETIRIMLRTLIPIFLMVIVCLLGKPDEKEHVDRFYAKMRTRVKTDRQEDDTEMALSMENPHRNDAMLLFPRSPWEFYKWNKEDAIGFAISVSGIFVILGLLYLLLTLGR